jgi:hypothetical protein
MRQDRQDYDAMTTLAAASLHIVTTVFAQTHIYILPSHKGTWMTFQFFCQSCFAWITVCSIANAGLHIRQSDLGIAVGLLGAFWSLGGSVGNAVFGTTLSEVLDQQLGPRITEVALAKGFGEENLSALNAFSSVPGVTASIEAATEKRTAERRRMRIR